MELNLLPDPHSDVKQRYQGNKNNITKLLNFFICVKIRNDYKHTRDMHIHITDKYLVDTITVYLKVRTLKKYNK